MAAKRTFPRTQKILLALQVAGDLLFVYCGLCLGYFIRFHTPLKRFGVIDPDLSFSAYDPLLALGCLLFLGSFAYTGLYDSRLLLRPFRCFITILRSIVFWVIIFLGVSLILKFQPSVSRIFVLISCLTTLFVIALWRYSFFYAVAHSVWRERIIQRVAFVGWSSEVDRLIQAIHSDKYHPYTIYGIIRLTGSEAKSPRDLANLGTVDQIDSILREHLIDIVVAADLNFSREQLLEVAGTCERNYADFKVIPSFFQIFVSNLHMQTISGVPLLGVDALPLRSVMNRMVKRTVDIVGALIGLAISLPVMAVMTVLIRRESPGPVLYRQTRTGRMGIPFTIYKMRSMRLDAESNSGPQWAGASDPRRLKIGAFMREWNLDELPQFWNILIGDMSLVGPRPERPELILQFEKQIPHYNPRHEVRPGLTGWAQVNGLRGNTSLLERIRYDLYYIENWTVWLDIQIMLLTFLRRENAY